MDLIACLDALSTSEVTSPESVESKECRICLDAYAAGDQVQFLGNSCPCEDLGLRSRLPRGLHGAMGTGERCVSVLW